MHICLDARLYGLKHAGIGRYIQNLSHHLVKQNPDTNFTLLLPPSVDMPAQAPNLATIACDISHYTLKEQINLPKVLKSVAADLYHFPHFNLPLSFNRPFVVTIHDLLWHQVKDSQATTLSPLKHQLKYFGYRQAVKHAVFASQAIIAPSQYVKSQILENYPAVDSAKIHVIYEGVDESLNHSVISNPSSVIHDPYLLYVGSLYPHKNLEFLIKTLDGRIPLKIISSRSVFQDNLKSWVNTHHYPHVSFMGYVSDAELKNLIKQATALVMPSLSEGFGLPGLEAMALGTPVLSSTAGSLPEIYGDSALFFDPHNPHSFLKQLALLTHKRSSLIKAGLKQAQKYSWVKAARQTMSLYKAVIKPES